MHDRTTFHVTLLKVSRTVTEEGLKMMCLFGKKGGPEAGNASRHCRRGTRHLNLDFSLSSYLPDGVFDFKPTEICHAAALPFSLHDIGGQLDGDGVISNRPNHDLCSSIKNASAPSFIYISTFFRLGATLIGIRWPTL
jgi:hypothetical protein